jgi:hypothetical protein
MAMSDVDHSEWAADDEGALRQRVGAEMVRAAVAEFLGMERSLRAAAAHLTAAEGMGALGDGAAGIAPEIRAMAARVTLAG